MNEVFFWYGIQMNISAAFSDEHQGDVGYWVPGQIILDKPILRTDDPGSQHS
jgi:hypothetical protein